MMRVKTPSTPQQTSNRWLQDYSDRSVLLPNGITLDPAQFPAPDANGDQLILSGTLIGKTDAEPLFGPAASTDDEIYFLWKDANLRDGNVLAEAVRRGTIYMGLLPTPIPAALKPILRQRNFQLVNYDGSGIDE